MTEGYEPVIGLEVHMQLATKSKAYSSDPASYGALPNHHISPVTLGHPGTLPVLNEQAVNFAIRLGLAVQSTITRENHFARKNYFYADLPKGYQITQDTTPICRGGTIRIQLKDGTEKHIGITRIHMEEDAGKSIHDVDPFHTLIDLNRAGVALLEMVSEPDIRSGEEAYQYVTEVRKLVRYLGICDGNMEEGSLRCDANISVRKKGTAAFGTKIEVKNMNSMRNVQRAIEHEISRQVAVLEAGGTLLQETRNFDAVTGTTSMMRSKEAANDYRYFPEPDISPVIVTEDHIKRIQAEMPALPRELHLKYTSQYQLSDYDAGVITENREFALYFEELTNHTHQFKAAANWMIGPVKSWLNEKAVEMEAFPLKPAALGGLITLVDSNKVNFSTASQRILPELILEPDTDPEEIAIRLNLIQEHDESALEGFIREAISRYPDKVTEYRKGKTGLLGLFMGEVMKLSQGKADPKVTSKLVKEMLDKPE
jgi:aspartyl-tRNA(Asn)/glutamyl-tRNA(Gln) amidotransferase subunit B